MYAYSIDSSHMDRPINIQFFFKDLLTSLSLLLLVLAGSVNAENFTVTVKDHQGKALAGVIVYATWLDGKIANELKHSAIDIRQKDKGFNPYLSVVQSNSSVTFSNLDDITHHIYSVTGIERFSYSLKSGKTTQPLSIDQAGIIAMGCNIHDWMSGYLLVVDTPYYGLTDDHGKIDLPIEQQGNFQITAWHPQFKEKLSVQTILAKQKKIELRLSKEMAAIPSQKSSDDFDFIEGY